MKHLSPKLAEQTRQEWREFGFFYSIDDERKEWQLTGSRAGLLKFVAMLLGYASNSRNDVLSEHDHLGPHMYLELMTWSEPGIDGHSIHGTLPDIARLAQLVEAKLAKASPGDSFGVREEYAPGAGYSLILRVKEDGFDTSTEDPQLEDG